MQLSKRKDKFGRDIYEILGAKINVEWSNFGGRPDKNFGKQGFDLDLSEAPEVAEALQNEGFNVVIRKNEKDPLATPYTHMTVLLPYYSDKNKAWLRPNVRTVSNKVLNELSEETIGSLDDSIVSEANLTIRLRSGTYQNRPFVQAQLIDGTFYVSGTKSAYEPSYHKQEEQFQKPPVTSSGDEYVPF